jgi:S1-C subfamily serine protease
MQQMHGFIADVLMSSSAKYLEDFIPASKFIPDSSTTLLLDVNLNHQKISGFDMNSSDNVFEQTYNELYDKPSVNISEYGYVGINKVEPEYNLDVKSDKSIISQFKSSSTDSNCIVIGNQNNNSNGLYLGWSEKDNRCIIGKSNEPEAISFSSVGNIRLHNYINGFLKSDNLGNISSSLINGLINSPEIYNNVKNAVSQISVTFDNLSLVVGSGWFYYETLDDLQKGYYVTAAHCILNQSSNLILSGYITNPITKNWQSININKIFYDGIGDVALIETGIDLTNYSNYALKIETNDINTGELCYVFGNPGGLDEDSISLGVVRDAHFVDTNGQQIVDSIFVSAPGIGGNSGGPILNENGNVIGLYTFGYNNTETFGGGINKYELQKSLSILKTLVNNKTKRYLGISWNIPNPYFISSKYNNASSFSKKGVNITNVDQLSPFYNILNVNDLLLSVSLNGETIDFGSEYDQKSPGILLYNYEDITIDINYISNSQPNTIQTSSVLLDKTYNDVPNSKDMYLFGGSSYQVDNLNNKLQINNNSFCI